MRIIRDIMQFVVNLIFPPRCIFCHRFLEPNCKSRVCGDCFNDIEFCSDSVCCVKCGKPIVSYDRKQLCYFCANEKTKWFNRIVSVFTYDGAAKDAILRFKSKGLNGYAESFSDCMMVSINEEYKGIVFDCIVGAPPHNKEKGFDQTELLCKKLSRKLGIPYIKNAMYHIRPVKKQSELGYKERRVNIFHSLALRKRVNVIDNTILLVDDVCTTRSTLMECSRCLKHGGAKSVYVITVVTVKSPD